MQRHMRPNADRGWIFDHDVEEGSEEETALPVMLPPTTATLFVVASSHIRRVGRGVDQNDDDENDDDHGDGPR